MKQNSVIEKLIALLNSRGGREVSTITLSDGQTIIGIPHGFHMFNDYCSMDIFDPKTATSRNIPLATVADIVTPGFH